MEGINARLLSGSKVSGAKACGSNDQKVDGTKAEPKTEDSTSKKNDSAKVKPTGKTVEVTVTAKSFDFDVKEIKAHVGDNIKIHLVNADGAHGFAIDEYGVDIKGGETAEFMATKKGEFQYYCSLMCGVGHDKMIGKLTVE
jgi:cytochrome c oxidase subunit 2